MGLRAPLTRALQAVLETEEATEVQVLQQLALAAYLARCCPLPLLPAAIAVPLRAVLSCCAGFLSAVPHSRGKGGGWGGCMRVCEDVRTHATHPQVHLHRYPSSTQGPVSVSDASASAGASAEWLVPPADFPPPGLADDLLLSENWPPWLVRGFSARLSPLFPGGCRCEYGCGCGCGC